MSIASTFVIFIVAIIITVVAVIVLTIMAIVSIVVTIIIIISDPVHANTITHTATVTNVIFFIYFIYNFELSQIRDF